ncbi:Calcineurin-like phosphoesterase [Propionibacterium cyclohexanicum]|uniref:Calcineurin-like phosphoesterase n=1 Tax=Propionibacterium cyclohexanicum TaxID=64702 RepID=A0A1H9Q762_9ACTN|nr:metallophosphoesterase family protein [Propionibacterium cyclohexanicum]SER56277.1 Calcineurin-like phosphoesterase [Propionibacterium cyclohexanicum]
MRKPYLATDLELLTITPTSAVISWMTRGPRRAGLPQPIHAGTQLWLGTDRGQMRLVHDDPQPRAFHQVEVKGLEPGREYHFRAMSDGISARPTLSATTRVSSPELTGRFVTLTPPPGRYLMTIALANDVHIGETRQGIVLGALPTSVAPGPRQADYPQMLFTRMLEDLNTRHGHPFLVLGGDITYGGTRAQTAAALRLATSYGAQGGDWLAVRGNHDRPLHSGEDPFGEQFVAYQQMTQACLPSGLRILGVDTTRGSGGGWVLPEQFEAIRSYLQEDPDRPTLVTSHHPVTRDAALSSPAGPQFMLRRHDQIELQHIERSAHGVFLHHTGHTHRMRRGTADVQGAHADYFENAACAAYPAGYALLHLYSGGYLLNFWRTSAQDALDWDFRSRWQVMGLAVRFMLGTTNDRNHVALKDLSGLSAAGGEIPAELRV